jgi:hypothetical protein
MAQAKDQVRISNEINMSVKQITFTNPAGSFVFHMERCSAEVMAHAAAFGLVRRISNAAAISRDEATGKSASDGEKLAAMREVAEYLETGTTEWTSRSTAGRVAGQDMALLVAAFMELRGVDRASATAWAKAKSPDQRAALMLNERIKVIVDRLRSQLAGDVDSDALLDEALDA